MKKKIIILSALLTSLVLTTSGCSKKVNIDNSSFNSSEVNNIFVVTFDSNGGNSVDSQNVEKGEKIKKPEDPTRFGYTFLGWYDLNTNEKWSFSGGVVTEDVVLTAKWETISYTIDYVFDNGWLPEGEIKTTYTIEDSFTLVTPIRPGYTFQGWDNGQSIIFEIKKGTTGNLILDAVWNDGDFYTIDLDADGGTLSQSSIVIQFNHTYELPTPEKVGYIFEGWYFWNILVNLEGVWRNIGIHSLKASWEIINYTIDYNLNGGCLNIGESNPTTYTVEDSITLINPIKEGYTFVGWYNEETPISSIDKGTTGNLTLEAKWAANKNNLSVISEDTSKGTVSITTGSGYSNESITVVATPVGDCVFKGWYSGETKVSGDATFTFTMPTNDYSLAGHFNTKEEERNEKLGITPVFSDDNTTVTYGLYPQTHVSDSATIAELNKLTTVESNGWYLYNDEYYTKITITEYDPHFIFDDGTAIESGATYWFKCEPIEWKILTSNSRTYSLVSTVLLDAHRYASSSNNYKDSEIRSWLNNEFLNSAFGLDSSLIQTTTVDNSASTTDNITNKYTCVNTEDKIYLLSYKDYLNADYGFSTSSSFTTTRECKATDYARANRIQYIITFDEINNKSDYWTRSPSSHDSGCAWLVGYFGSLDYYFVGFTYYGVRPALTIKI